MFLWHFLTTLVIVVGVSCFYFVEIKNIVCGKRLSLQVHPLIQRKKIMLGGGDVIKPKILMYYVTKNLFFGGGVINMFIDGYTDPSMTPSAIQNRLLANHLAALKAKIGNGPHNYKSIEKQLKKILLFGERDNGKKNSYHYEKVDDNIFIDDFLKKFKRMCKLAFAMPTSNIAGDGTYRYGSNIMTPYFQRDSSDKKINDESKENKINTFESADFLKDSYKLKCRLLVFVNHLNLVMHMRLAPDQSGEGESHEYLVCALASVFMEYLIQ